MPVYNAERFLAEALDSILRQTFHDFEVVAVNDGSTDESLRILRAFASMDRRIRIVDLPHAGIVGALNAGIKASKGEVIARMDADDHSLPFRIEKQVAYLASHPECVAVGSNLASMTVEGGVFRTWNQPLSHAAIDGQYLNGKPGAIAHATAVVRKDAADRIGGYREGYLAAEDMDFFLRLAEHGQLANLPEVLYHYRIVSSGMWHSYTTEALFHTCRAAIEAHYRRGMPAPWFLFWQAGIHLLELRKFSLG
jgi:glycosyltransferase involved in cell wall biosynthesis